MPVEFEIPKTPKIRPEDVAFYLGIELDTPQKYRSLTGLCNRLKRKAGIDSISKLARTPEEKLEQIWLDKNSVGLYTAKLLRQEIITK